MPSDASRRSGRRGGRQPRSGRDAPRRGPRTADPLVGHTIGGHKLLQRTGSDTYTTTYKANHAAMARLVTFKALKPEAAQDPATVERFRETAKAVAQVHHPTVASIYDVSTAQDVHFATMEYVEGRSVVELLKARQKIASDDAVRVATAVAEGLRFANSRGIPGFRLSPARVVLTSQGEVKILPPTFTPPDAAVLDEAYVLRATGLLLYAMLTGGRVAKIDQALAPDAPPPALQPVKKVAMGTRRDLAEVVDRMVGIPGAEPYADVAAALADLRQVLERAERVESRTRSATERAKDRKRRHLVMAGVAIGIGAVFLLIVGALLLSHRSQRERAKRDYGQALRAAKESIDRGQALWAQWWDEPDDALLEKTLAAYGQAKVPYQEFIAAHRDAPQAAYAQARIEEIDEAIEELEGKAASHERRLREVRAYNAVCNALEAEIDRKLQTGGTLDLAAWRKRFADLLNQFPNSPRVQQNVERRLRHLPEKIRTEQMRIDANQLDRDFKKRYYPDHQYAEAIADVEAFRKKYDPYGHLREEMLKNYHRLKDKVDMVARTNFPTQLNHANHLASQGKYDQAREIYQRMIRSYSALNRNKFVKDAKKALAKLPNQ
ncbi:MAG: serine/threonine protein kinase [Planctomycetota bacterium]